VTPLPNESESDFIVRFHKVNGATIPDTDARQRAAVTAWRAAKGIGPLEQRALETFPDSDFVHVRDVPVFAQHEVEAGADGKPSHYDRAALQAIVERCNYRIADTGDFSGLSDGHTPDAEELSRGADMPDLLGFAGPFRMGMIGKENPRWAIFADEHHFREEAERVRKNPRRSPEVWLSPRMEDRFFDPIAALGVEAPRLDMGSTRYCRTSSGRIVQKYSASAFPGAMNCAPADFVSVPKSVPKSVPTSTSPVNSPVPREKNSAADQSPEGNPAMALTTEDLAQIVQAVQETAVFKWAAAQMEAQGADDVTPGDGTPPVDDVTPGNPPGTPPGAPPVDKNSMPGATPPAAPPVTSPAVPPMNDPNKPADPYAMARYSKMQSELDALKADNAKTKAELDLAKGERRKAERYSRLQAASTCHVIDLEEEVKRAEKMDDDRFEDHMKVIVEHYERIPVNGSIFVPEEIGGQVMTEKYKRDTSRKATDLVIRERAAGREMSFETALEQVRGGK